MSYGCAVAPCSVVGLGLGVVTSPVSGYIRKFRRQTMSLNIHHNDSGLGRQHFQSRFVNISYPLLVLLHYVCALQNILFLDLWILLNLNRLGMPGNLICNTTAWLSNILLSSFGRWRRFEWGYPIRYLCTMLNAASCCITINNDPS